jgi:hypothetical protein
VSCEAENVETESLSLYNVNSHLWGQREDFGAHCVTLGKSPRASLGLQATGGFERGEMQQVVVSSATQALVGNPAVPLAQ